MNKTIFITGVIFGVLAVSLGAFGAHGLEKLIDTESIGTFETGVRYQMYHALLLLILASVTFLNGKEKKVVFILLVMGIVLFSFSIYMLATNSLTAFNFKKIALLTPLGGTLLISAWLILGIKVLRKIN